MSLRPKIVILTGNHLCHNPRVLKEAAALADAGFEVEVLGAWFDTTLKERDIELLANAKFKYSPVIDLTQTDAQTRIRRFACRLRTKLGQLVFRHGGIENHWQLGFAVTALERAARRSQADLFIAHSEAALWAIKEIGKQKAESGKQQSEMRNLESRKQKTNGTSQFQLSTFSFQDFRIGVDMEDWYSEDLLPEARRQRPVKLLRSMEREALSGAAHSTCTSRAMSEALAKEYGCRPPTVIYNAFPWADRQKLDGLFKDRKNRTVRTIHWYSQTLGYGRGLEELFDALPHVRHAAEIHLRGKPMRGFQEWLILRVPEAWRARVFVHDLVANDELLSRIAEHDIGFAGEMKYCRSRDLTVTNKILHYLLGGLAVVASDTAGQREIAEQACGAVRIYPSGDSQALAAQLNALLASAEELQSAKAAALMAAEKNFCWERQVPRLVWEVETGLATASGSKENPRFLP